MGPHVTTLLNRRRVSAWLTAVPLAMLLAFTTQTASAGIVLFRGDFARNLHSWRETNGGPQCANYGTPSKAPRLRGDLMFGRINGVAAGRFELPASRLPTYPLEACELITRRSLRLGSDDYYSYMFYVPKGWTSGTRRINSSFWGIATAQFHFQNIWGSPIVFELHDDHMTLALETGACHNYVSPRPGCQWRSNADNPNGRPGNLGALYVVPRPMRKGVWQEIVVHVHWAADRSGVIQVWNRLDGAAAWTETVDLRGYPTVQWDVARGCCDPTVYDKIGAYRGVSSVPVPVWLGGFAVGTGFAAVASTMPGPP